MSKRKMKIQLYELLNILDVEFDRYGDSSIYIEENGDMEINVCEPGGVGMCNSLFTSVYEIESLIELWRENCEKKGGEKDG